MDITKLQAAQWKLQLFVSISRTSKFCHTRLYFYASKSAEIEFLMNLIAITPYKIVTDNVL